MKHAQHSHLIGFHWVGSRDGKNHYFNCYNKALQLATDGFSELATEHYGLVRVSERVKAADGHFGSIFDGRNRSFSTEGIASLITERYRDYSEDATVANQRQLVEAHGPIETAGICCLTTDYAMRDKLMTMQRGCLTPASYRNCKSRQNKRLAEAVLINANNPFAVPPVEELPELFARMEPGRSPYLWASGGWKTTRQVR